MPTCYKCGSTDVEIVNEDQGYAVCAPCEDAYQASLQAEYPNGQCQECGAVGFAWDCPNGKTHVSFLHSEGGCSQWSDRGDYPGADCPECPPVERPEPDHDAIRANRRALGW